MRRKVISLLSKNNFPGSRLFKAILNYSFNIIKTRNVSNTSEYDSEKYNKIIMSPSQKFKLINCK